LVASPNRAYYNPVDREAVLALDDLLLDEHGIEPYGADVPTHALMGRWGNVLLVNGEPRWRMDVRRGDVVRFFLTNVASARVLNLSFGGARIKVVATDGGKLEREEWATSIVIAPAERYVVEARFDEPGPVAITNRVQALDHMYGTYALEVDTVGMVDVTEHGAPPSAAAARAFARLRANADVAAELARWRSHANRAPDRTLVLSLRTHGLPGPVAQMLNSLNVPMDWNDGMTMANWVSTAHAVTWVLRDAETGRENMDAVWHFRRGELAKVRLFNDPTTAHAMGHPIHLHGQRVVRLARTGVPTRNLAWKDTAIIPAGETVDLLIEMSNPGNWLLHCHIAEHMGAGMMMRFVVE